MTVKERVMDVVRDLPDDATIEDAIYRLHLLAKIDRGLAEETAGELLTQDDVRRRLAPFLTPR
jgi:predicted transcriptional regulator